MEESKVIFKEKKEEEEEAQESKIEEKIKNINVNYKL